MNLLHPPIVGGSGDSVSGPGEDAAVRGPADPRPPRDLQGDARPVSERVGPGIGRGSALGSLSQPFTPYLRRTAFTGSVPLAFSGTVAPAASSASTAPA